MKPAPVLVKRPDPVTGELVEEVRPAASFRKEQQPLPISDEVRLGILAGEQPGITWAEDEEPSLELGQLVQLSSRISFVVTRMTKTKSGGRRAHYLVIDDRPTIPRRVPLMFELPALDEYGDPIQPSKEAIEAAAIDGNYCQSNSLAVPDIAEEVDINYRRSLGVSARARVARRKRMDDPQKEAERDVEALSREMRELGKRAAKMGIDVSLVLAPIAKQIEEAHRDIGSLKKAA